MMWTADRVKQVMVNSDWELCKCIVTIFRKQTIAEQANYSTGEWNGVGFNKFDAKILTSFAKQILENHKKGKRLLSDKQIALARKRMPKYAKQLAKIANGEL